MGCLSFHKSNPLRICKDAFGRYVKNKRTHFNAEYNAENNIKKIAAKWDAAGKPHKVRMVNVHCYIFIFLCFIFSIDVMASDFFPILERNDQCQQPGTIALILEKTWVDEGKLYGRFKISKVRPALDKEVYLDVWENKENNFVSASLYFRPLNSNIELMFSNEIYEGGERKYVHLKNREEPKINIQLSKIQNIHNVGNWFVVFRQQGLCFRSYVFTPESAVKGYKTIDIVEHAQTNNFLEEGAEKMFTQDEIKSLQCTPEYFMGTITEVEKKGDGFKGNFLFKNKFNKAIKIKGKRSIDEFSVYGLSYARVLGLKELVGIDIGDRLFSDDIDMVELKPGQEFIFSMDLPSEFFARHSDFWIL